MNISTGGPHILIFERDQQLAVLLTSELQLAGYECHVARTAVEVFDAIARFSIRLVLINLAQAAASRREFWVALDTQRRGSGIQVFTFHCSSLAGYGPRDPDDYGQASMADMEIDGMVGLMKLVDTVRARVPGAEVSATTMPRIPRTPIHNNQPDPQPSARSRFADSDSTLGSVSRSANRPLPQPSMNTTSPSAMQTSQGTLQASLATSPATQLPGGNQATYSDKIRAVLYPNPHSPIPHSGIDVKNNIGLPRSSSTYESDTAKAYPPQIPPLPNPTASFGTSVLQRLANGQIYSSPGLAELSRLVNGQQSTDRQENSSQPIAYQPWGAESMRPSSNMRVEQIGSNALTYAPPDRPDNDLGIMSSMSSLPQAETNKQERGRDSKNGGSVQPEIPASRTTSGALPTALRAAPIEDLPLERLPGNQPMYGIAVKPQDGASRAKEILPSQPTSTTTATSNWPIESSSPMSLNVSPSVPARSVEKESTVSQAREIVSLATEPTYQRDVTEYSRQSDHSQKLAYQREATEPLRQSDRSQKRGNVEPARRADRVQEPGYERGNVESARRVDRVQEPGYERGNAESARRADRVQEPGYERGNAESARHAGVQEPGYEREVAESPHQSDRVQEHLNLREEFESLRRSERSQESIYQDILSGKDTDESTNARNAVILDILRSLPAVAMPSDQQEQAIQPQVHNGRATRSLGNVLLDGHLVPQDRLEVAQNIQRMLRGVDMSYQLGEILLMFKLLTPDQLLAASLVGYGLITRTQISALGRIRQELHAIGLEYDLENLVILFRILTPEQLREARSSVLG